MVGRHGDRLVAAIWAQIRGGRMASLRPPGLATGESATTAAAIIDLAADKAAAVGARAVQSLLETDAGLEAKWLRLCGFQHIADLLYLVSLRKIFPTRAPESELEFEPLGKAGELGISETQTKRLVGIIRQTYIDTQDCPAVHGMRATDDVLATYRAVDNSTLHDGFSCGRKSADIGCLIMASHPQEQNCELIYMGIAPEARGNGFGLEIVRYAQWLAGKCEGGEKIAGGNCNRPRKHSSANDFGSGCCKFSGDCNVCGGRISNVGSAQRLLAKNCRENLTIARPARKKHREFFS